jgi:valyl-tRNA synthetase
MGQIVSLANEYAPAFSDSLPLSPEDRQLLETLYRLAVSVGSSLDKYQFSYAQEKACGFLSYMEEYARGMKAKGNLNISLSVLRQVYLNYLIILHPFMPFMTEELYTELYNPVSPLAVAPWPGNKSA